MSEHFYTFQGEAGTTRLVTVSGVVGGDRILQVIAVSGGAGDFTSHFQPYAPGGSLIVQDNSDLSAYTFLLRVQRAD